MDQAVVRPLPERDFDANADVLRAIAHPLRLRILCTLKDSALSVGDVEMATGIGQPGLSQQLAVLRRAHLVNTRKVGKQVIYSVARERMLAVADMLDALAGTTVG